VQADSALHLARGETNDRLRRGPDGGSECWWELGGERRAGGLPLVRARRGVTEQALTLTVERPQEGARSGIVRGVAREAHGGDGQPCCVGGWREESRKKCRE